MSFVFNFAQFAVQNPYENTFGKTLIVLVDEDCSQFDNFWVHDLDFGDEDYYNNLLELQAAINTISNPYDPDYVGEELVAEYQKDFFNIFQKY